MTTTLEAASGRRTRTREADEGFERKGRVELVIIYALLCLSAVLAVVPLLWAFSSSFSPNQDVFAHAYPFSWRALVPVNFTFEAYVSLFNQGFGHALLNTLVLGLVTVALGGLIAAAAGFAFARFTFPLKNTLFVLVLLTFMVPADLTAIPRYTLINDLGWLNTWLALLIPGLANSLVIFLFRQFMEEIPQEIIDAARVDGASWLRIFFEIMLPLSKPMLISAGLILFLSQWEAFFWPLLVAPSPDMQLVQTAISSAAVQQYRTVWNELFAGSMLAAIIPILLAIPFQHYYVRAITGSVKG
jgi:multiple sugar transport system permease protein